MALSDRPTQHSLNCFFFFSKFHRGKNYLAMLVPGSARLEAKGIAQCCLICIDIFNPVESFFSDKKLSSRPPHPLSLMPLSAERQLSPVADRLSQAESQATPVADTTGRVKGNSCQCNVAANHPTLSQHWAGVWQCIHTAQNWTMAITRKTWPGKENNYKNHL